ncbi:unnamed protein product [Boreogadus saida]
MLMETDQREEEESGFRFPQGVCFIVFVFEWIDPYVKVSLICDGRRLKKRKTTTKRSTLNPVYNEAIIFDIPPENVEQVSLSITVMDYDRVGHNEVIGVCYTGPDAQGLGRDHWTEMLAYPRKPITHWHSLGEDRRQFTLPPPGAL